MRPSPTHFAAARPALTAVLAAWLIAGPASAECVDAECDKLFVTDRADLVVAELVAKGGLDLSGLPEDLEVRLSYGGQEESETLVRDGAAPRRSWSVRPRYAVKFNEVRPELFDAEMAYEFSGPVACEYVCWPWLQNRACAAVYRIEVQRRALAEIEAQGPDGLAMEVVPSSGVFKGVESQCFHGAAYRWRDPVVGADPRPDRLLVGTARGRVPLRLVVPAAEGRRAVVVDLDGEQIREGTRQTLSDYLRRKLDDPKTSATERDLLRQRLAEIEAAGDVTFDVRPVEAGR